MKPQRSLAFYIGFVLLATLTVTPLVSALDVPPLRGRVNDLAGLMPPARARDLAERLRRFEEQTGHQVAVLTIPSLEGEDLEGFSIRVAENWKIGKKGFDNGVILLIARNDRKLRIEVGYGLEGILPDAIASRIIREVIVPRFRANDYAGGIEAGVEAILKVTGGEPLPERARAWTGSGNRLPSLAEFSILLLLGLALVGMLRRLSGQRRSEIWSARGTRRYRSRATDPLGEADFFMGGFGGGGGFSGGGGGFGGGGASGSW